MSDTFLFYRSWADILEEVYADDEATLFKIYAAIIRHGIYGRNDFPAERTFLKQAFAQIDIAHENREAKIEAGRKGGMSGTGESKARYGNKNASKKNKTQAQLANTQPNVNVNDNDNVHANEHEHENENEHLHENASSRSPSGTAPLDGGGPSGVEDEGCIDFEWGDDD